MNLPRRYHWWLFLVLLLAAFFVRVYKINQIPASLYYDEVDLGYQARSLIVNGKDYRGVISPFFVRSFNSDRTPLPAYATVVSTLLFRDPQLQVRMPFVILGTIIVVLVFALVNLWTQNFWLSFIVGGVVAFSPWQIQFSRFSHEATVLMSIYLFSFWCLFKWLKTRSDRYYWSWVFLLAMGVYSYRTMSLFVPLTFVFIGLIYHREFLKLGIKKLFGGVLLAATIVLPFMYVTTIGSADQPRIAQLSVTSDPTVPIWIQRNREVDSGDYIDHSLGKKPAVWSYGFHNKLISWLDNFSNNYFKAWSSEFLFTDGDPNWRQSVGMMGELYKIDILAILVGLWWVVKRVKEKHYQTLLVWLVLAPIPSALTVDGMYHASRLFLLSIPLLIIIGIGWWRLVEVCRRLVWGKWFLVVLMGIWLGMFSFYLHRYFVHYPIESARDFGYGYKEAMLKIKEVQDQYDHIYLVDTKDPPMIYYLFWADVNPREVQKYGTNFSVGNLVGQPLDKIKVINWDKDTTGKTFAQRLSPHSLYLVTQNELKLDLRGKDAVPPGVKLIDLIKYPDNEVAFYLVAGDQRSLTKP